METCVPEMYFERNVWNGGSQGGGMIKSLLIKSTRCEERVGGKFCVRVFLNNFWSTSDWIWCLACGQIRAVSECFNLILFNKICGGLILSLGILHHSLKASIMKRNSPQKHDSACKVKNCVVKIATSWWISINRKQFPPSNRPLFFAIALTKIGYPDIKSKFLPKDSQTTTKFPCFFN